MKTNNLEHLFSPPFKIEMREVGIWWDIEHNIKTLTEALYIASVYSKKFDDDNRIRIIDSVGKII